MTSNLYSSVFRQAESIVLEDEVLKVTLVPSVGGKIASLIFKPDGKELLWQNPAPGFLTSVYDSSFATGDMSGIDDMFPTIDECCYPDGPWQGTRLPDHGEVWSLPWDYQAHSNTEEATLSVFGVRIPYKLSKTLRLTEGRLELKYRLENLSPFAFKFIWALHPLFNADEYTRILLPESVTRVINVGKSPLRLGAYGTIHPWPITENGPGKFYDMSKIRPFGQGNYEKYYVQGIVPEGWCALRNERNGLEVRLTFPPQQVPYLGIWVNEGAYQEQYNVAPEPCTGAFDRLDMADCWGTVASVPGRGIYEWQIGINVISP